MTEQLLTTAELAERLRISPHTIRLWSSQGRIPTVWLSPAVRRFDWTEVLAVVRESDRHPARQ
jgi:DNA-binding transcriptional MerR regulator